MSSFGNARIYSRYRYILWIFILFSAILATVLLYYNFSSAKITISINAPSSSVSKEFAVAGKTEKSDNFSVKGKIIESEVSGNLKIRPAKEETKQKKISGSITVINNSAKDQPLVSGTRLLGEMGVMFRTQKTITVPAKKQTAVEALADDADIEAVPPQKFTIVALWPGLQDKIYGITNEPILAFEETVRITKKEDIERGKSELEKTLYENGLAKLNDLSEKPLKISNNLVIKEMIEISHTGKIAEPQDEFEVSGTMRLIAVAVDPEEIKTKLLTEQEDVLKSPKALASVKDAEIRTSALDLKTNTARIAAKLALPSNLPKIDPFIKKSLTGKTPAEITEYLKRAVFAKAVKIKMRPVNLPILIAPEDNITIEYASIPL